MTIIDILEHGQCEDVRLGLIIPLLYIWSKSLCKVREDCEHCVTSKRITTEDICVHALVNIMGHSLSFIPHTERIMCVILYSGSNFPGQHPSGQL